MTYSCTNPGDLHELASKAEELITGRLPKSERLILRPEARKNARQSSGNLQKVYGLFLILLEEDDTKMIGDDWRCLNRVG